MTLAKICGLTTAEALDAALDGGAAMVGFVMISASPRYAPPLLARKLVERARGRARTVLLFADTPRDVIDRLVHDIAPDMIQLHGRETILDIANARNDYDLPVIKAIGVGGTEDFAGIEAYEAEADHLMLDARPPKGASRTGGHGLSFDWSLLAGRNFAKPWFLAGGLNPGNVAEAVRISGAPLVDVSSGVESAPGVKDAGLIAAFLKAVQP